jgi:hypothetical protein
MGVNYRWFMIVTLKGKGGDRGLTMKRLIVGFEASDLVIA